MSTLVTNFICSTIMSVMGLFVVKNISGSKENLVNRRTIVLMLLLISIPAFIHTEKYTYIFTIIIYAMTIVIYKKILNISFVKSIVSCAIMVISMLFLDAIALTILANFITMDQLRNTWYLNIIVNVIFTVILVGIYNIKPLKKTLPEFVDKLVSKKVIKIVVSLIIVVIVISVILNTMSDNFSINDIFTTDFIIITFFFTLIMLLLGERKSYEKLYDEYDSLFNYVQIFEDWIEKEQLTRHEYKNQLAVLRSLSKEKKVKDKIDSINDEFINIDNENISQLKGIPNGGLKGLLYYKISVANTHNVNIVIDIEEKLERKLSKLSRDKNKTLTKLLGIYLDNAIEAALETKRKIVTIEIYEINGNIKIVISNTYDTNKSISNRNKKGFSTKGKNRGNGLYFASKIISLNNWVEENQKVVDDFYIQELIIKK